jgi:hypothetical protein
MVRHGAPKAHEAAHSLIVAEFRPLHSHIGSALSQVKKRFAAQRDIGKTNWGAIPLPQEGLKIGQTAICRQSPEW